MPPVVPTGAQIWVAASQVQGCIYVREATASYSLRQNSVTIIRSVNPQVRLVWQKPVGLRARSHHVSTLVRVAMCAPKGGACFKGLQWCALYLLYGVSQLQDN